MHSIPTLYNGIVYRSRLEATWAAFFDRWFNANAVTVIYEPFDCYGWIPDFLLRLRRDDDSKSLNWLVEIKPITEFSADVARKMMKATRTEDHDFMMLGLSPMFAWVFFGDQRVPVWTGNEMLRALKVWSAAKNATQWKSPQRIAA